MNIYLFCILCFLLYILCSVFVLVFWSPPASTSCLALGLPFACSACLAPECAQLIISDDDDGHGCGAMMIIMIIIIVYDDDDDYVAHLLAAFTGGLLCNLAKLLLLSRDFSFACFGNFGNFTCWRSMFAIKLRIVT